MLHPKEHRDLEALADAHLAKLRHVETTQPHWTKPVSYAPVDPSPPSPPPPATSFGLGRAKKQRIKGITGDGFTSCIQKARRKMRETGAHSATANGRHVLGHKHVSAPARRAYSARGTQGHSGGQHKPKPQRPPTPLDTSDEDSELAALMAAGPARSRAGGGVGGVGGVGQGRGSAFTAFNAWDAEDRPVNPT